MRICKRESRLAALCPQWLIVIALTLPMSAWAKPPAEVFGVLPTIYDAAISPDATQIAVIVNIDGTYGIRIISLLEKDEKMRVVALGDGIKPSWVRWANNERVLAGLWRSQRFDTLPITVSFIYTMDARSMQGKTLIDPRRVFRQDNSDVVDFLPDDPDHILMAFSKDGQRTADVRRVNVATGKHKLVKRGRTYIQEWFTDHRGVTRVGQGLSEKGRNEAQWRLIIRDADEDTWRDFDEYPGLRGDTKIFGFSDNPNELIIGRYAGRDTLGIYVYDLLEKRVSRPVFHHDKYDAQRIVVNSKTHAVVGAEFVADSVEVELLDDYQSLLQRMRQRFENFTVSYIDQSVDGKTLLFKVSNGSFPGVLALLNAGDAEPKILGYFRHELAELTMGSVMPVTYTARDDQTIPAYMTLPISITSTDKVRNLPFIVMPHGGPYSRSSNQFDYFAQYFASRGFGVLQMNFRGSSGYGKSFEESGRKDWVVMQDDVTDAARWLLEKGYADPERMCIAGWSYGGYAALIGAIKEPDSYACAISMAGVTDLNDLIFDLKKYRFGRLASNEFIRDGFDSKKELRNNSPVQRADELKVPVFLAHGVLDQRVHFDQFKRMRSALRRAGADATFVEFEDEDHFLSNQKHRQTFFRELDAFFNKALGANEFMP